MIPDSPAVKYFPEWEYRCGVSGSNFSESLSRVNMWIVIRRVMKSRLPKYKACERFACEKSKSNKSDRQNKAGYISATGKAMLTSPPAEYLMFFLDEPPLLRRVKHLRPM